MTTVVTCTELAQAQLLKSALEGNGIQAYLPDELTAQTAPPYTWATGGVRVQVEDEDADEARALLEALSKEQPAQLETEPAGDAPEVGLPLQSNLTSGHVSEPAVINLAAKFAHFSEQWRPKIIAELNGQHVKLVKLRGEFVWHRHELEDELFLVVAGQLRMEFHDRTVTIAPGELIVVPRGVEHRPSSDEEVQVLLFEPATTVNTGSAGGARTVAAEWI